MVEPCIALASLLPARGGLLAHAAADATQPLLLRLDPVQRANVIMTLLGLLLVGGTLMAIVFFAGRHLRRAARQRNSPTPRHEDDWYRKPLVPPEPTTGQLHEPE